MTMHRFSQGGADRVGVILANGLVRAGIPTHIALLRDGGEGDQSLRALAEPGVSIGSAGRPLGSRHLELLRGVRFLRHEIATRRPDLVLASSNNMGLVTGLAARRRDRAETRLAMKVTNPVVRPCDYGRLRRAYRHGLYRFVFAHYDRILTLTDAEREVIEDICPSLFDRLTTVPNPYVLDDICSEQPLKQADAPPRILAIGRLMPQKRFDLLLRAFARLPARDAQLTIVGEGPLRGHLEQLIVKLGIADRVAMPGFVNNVSAHLKGADLLAISSDYEGLPAVLLESLSFNVPVVTTDCFAGARDLLANAARCRVTPRGDSAAFSSALQAGLVPSEAAHDLRPLARPYAIHSAIAAHVAALMPLLGAHA